jgi:hypothetical protein
MKIVAPPSLAVLPAQSIFPILPLPYNPHGIYTYLYLCTLCRRAEGINVCPATRGYERNWDIPFPQEGTFVNVHSAFEIVLPRLARSDCNPIIYMSLNRLRLALTAKISLTFWSNQQYDTESPISFSSRCAPVAWIYPRHHASVSESRRRVGESYT